MRKMMKNTYAYVLGNVIAVLKTRVVKGLAALTVMGGAVVGAWMALDHFGYVDQAQTQVSDLVGEATERLGLTVETVAVRNNDRVATIDVIRASGIQAGQSLHSINADVVKAKIEKLGWVRSASVRRALPDRVVITVEERQPFAVWQVDGVHHLIDQTGHIIERDLNDGFDDLVLVVGKGANEMAADLLSDLDSNPQLGSRVIAAVRVSERRWNVQLDNKVDVRLPEDGVANAWTLLAQMQEDHRILNKDILSVDLRVPGQVILRTTPEEAERRLGNGKNT